MILKMMLNRYHRKNKNPMYTVFATLGDKPKGLEVGFDVASSETILTTLGCGHSFGATILGACRVTGCMAVRSGRPDMATCRDFRSEGAVAANKNAVILFAPSVIRGLR